MSIFRYRPLRTATAIRLVILPRCDMDRGDTRVQPVLEEVEMADTSKKYCALSHAWGKAIGLIPFV